MGKKLRIMSCRVEDIKQKIEKKRVLERCYAQEVELHCVMPFHLLVSFSA
jgi:hypothetical protein